jgi:hypothetical protein
MNITEIRVDGTGLLIEGQRVELPHPIGKALKHQGLVIVMLEVPPTVVFNRNVLAFTEAAAPAWQIEESPHGTERDKPYVGISVGNDGALVASNWNGVDYRVNPESGKVTVRAFKK